MKTVILRAPLLSCSGYGTHSRQVYRWLKSKNVNVVTQVVPWGITSWMINPDSSNGLIGQIMKDSKDFKGHADLSIQVQLPNEWNTGLAKRNVGISAYVETDQCNPQWISKTNMMDMVVVPSEHVKQCILNTSPVKTPVHVIPESFYDAGMFAIYSSDFIKNNKTSLNFNSFRGYVVPAYRVTDIDWPEDWVLAEKLYKALDSH